jgi:hypothetical protein
MNITVSAVRRVTNDDTRFRLHNWLCSRPVTMRGYALLQPKVRGGVVNDRTDLVLEGFPRSANTYALAAFRRTNGPGPVVASHLHTAVSVVEGVRRGLPVVVVVRDPVDACASMIQRQPVTPRSALTAYIRFNSTVVEHLTDVVVSDFAVTTSSFGSVIKELNQRFGTTFTPYDHTETNERWCREFVIEADRTDQGLVRARTVALPQASRRRESQAVKNAVRQEKALVHRAEDAYHAVLAQGS